MGSFQISGTTWCGYRCSNCKLRMLVEWNVGAMPCPACRTRMAYFWGHVRVDFESDKEQPEPTPAEDVNARDLLADTDPALDITRVIRPTVPTESTDLRKKISADLGLDGEDIMDAGDIDGTRVVRLRPRPDEGE